MNNNYLFNITSRLINGDILTTTASISTLLPSLLHLRS